MQLTKLLARLGLAAFALFTLSLQLSTASAQGTAFTYQGVLSQGGVAVNGSNDLTFTLYNAASAGATVGTSNVVNDLVMSNGLFTVTLDFGAGAFDGAARWLQIAARPGLSLGAYTNLAPRTPITPTPYAIYAGGASAANLVGTVADARLSANVALREGGNAFSGNQTITDGLVGIGTINPATMLTVNQATYGIEHTDGTRRLSTYLDATGCYFGTVSTDPLLFYVNDGSASMMVNTNGNVGIGTGSPSEKLHVDGNILASGNILADGNVGIGTSTPARKVTVNADGYGIEHTDGSVRLSTFVQGDSGWFGTVSPHPLHLFVNDGGSAMAIGTNNNTEFAGQVTATRFFGDGSGLTGIGASNLTGTVADARLSANVALRSGGNTFTGNQIVTSGKVGIGTTNPIGSINYPGGWDGLHARSPGGHVLHIIQGTNSARLHLRTDSNITNAQDFIIANDADRVEFRWLGAGLGNGPLALSVATNANVGIGKLNPATKLDVAGTVTATGYIGDGSGLTGIAAANVSGTLADARLSANVALRAGGNTFSGGHQIITGGNVGIRVTNPLGSIGYLGGWEGLHSQSPAGNGLNIIQGANSARLHLRADNNITNIAQDFIIANGANRVDFQWLGGSLANRLRAMTIATNGNVGIGTANPGALLHLVSGNSPTIKLQSDGFNEISGRVSMRQVNDTGFDTYYDGNALVDGLVFESFTSGTPTTKAVVMKLNGNVGIGATNPASRLHVLGTGDTEISLQSSANNRRWTLQASGGADGAGLGGTFQIIDRTAVAARMVIGTDGNVTVPGEVTTTAMNITSDRNAKEQFKPVNAREVLAKVARLPISEWQYKTQSDARHIGPMAQDFREAFSLGRDEKHITSVDADGVALAAIQGLNEKLEEKTQEVDALKKSVAALTELVNKLAAQQNGGAR